MAVDFSAFKETVSADEIKRLEEQYKVQENNNYEPLPSGTYEVELNRMEVGESSWGTNQINITFKITGDDHTNQLIFYNGTFDDHFAHGLRQTARLISAMTNGEIPEEVVLHNLTKDVSEVGDYLADLFDVFNDRMGWDLNYRVQQSKKLNPNTNKPYTNYFFSIEECFDI